MASEQTPRGRVIRASEIGEYLYCHRAWWLGRVRGVANTNRAALDAGTARHAAHGQAVRQAGRLAQLARLVFLAAIILAIVLLVSIAQGPG